jgi:environmental stress-induced protein Ves
MEVLRESGYVAVPWKNGGGITREILREPAAPTAFDWRLSLASIEAPGPFSAFEGYERTLILVRGAGVELIFDDGHASARLSAAGDMARFDGGWQTRCSLLNGPSEDLNLIVSRQRVRSMSRMVPLELPAITPTADWPDTLICCVAGSAQLSNGNGERVKLNAVDVGRCAPADGPVICEPRADRTLIFIAHLSSAIQLMRHG